MRVVVDANVAVAALLRPAGPTRRLLDSRAHAWHAPRALLDELTEHEAEFAARAAVPPGRWRAHVTKLQPLLTWATAAQMRPFARRAARLAREDPDDAPYLACAWAVGAEFLWTFDRRLASIAPLRAGSWPLEPEPSQD